ncbi:MAG: NAD(+) synthase [Dehalococcoidales bacterium]|nr:NAD(+) synthase [Dehalococcoidales bacterium]
MEKAQLTVDLVNWIQARVKEAGAKGIVIGVSGGIDSAVLAVLCEKAAPGRVLGLALPCYSNPEDEAHAKLLMDKFNIPLRVINLDTMYDSFLKILPCNETTPAAERLAKSNLKVRLRMLTLYYHANLMNYMVVGSSNRSELAVGYFTKWGDGGVDIMPLGNLVKQQVIDLAEYLGIPRPIIDKPPSAGLWDGQTDEKEMGLTYKELDRFLSIGRAEPEAKLKIQTLMAKSNHKRCLPPVPDF